MKRYCTYLMESLLVIVVIVSLSCFLNSAKAENLSVSSKEDDDGSGARIIAAFNILGNEMKEQQKTLHMMKRGVNSYVPYSYSSQPVFGDYIKSYIPSFFKKRERQDYDGDAYIPREIYARVLQKTKGYRWLYLHAGVWEGEYFFVVIQNQEIFSIRPYLKSGNCDSKFSSREIWGVEMKERFENLLKADNDLEKIQCVEKMKEISDPEWYLEIRSKKISHETYEKIDKIMNLFKNRDYFTKEECINSVRLDDSYSFIHNRYLLWLDGSPKYSFYGYNSEIFGVSLAEDALSSYEHHCGWTSPSSLISYFFKSIGFCMFNKQFSEKEIQEDLELMFDQMKLIL